MVSIRNGIHSELCTIGQLSGYRKIKEVHFEQLVIQGDPTVAHHMFFSFDWV